MLVWIAGGGLVLYGAYLLIHGESPRPTQRVASTVPAPVVDPIMQPQVSGSVSSITKAIAEDANDPTLTDRPTELGGDAANTGTKKVPVTTKSIEQKKAPVAYSEEVNRTVCKAESKVSGYKIPLASAKDAKYHWADGQDAASNWRTMNNGDAATKILSDHDCMFDFGSMQISNINPAELSKP